MASLFSTAIVAFCAGTSGQYHEACLNATDAGTRQSGWRASADNVEDKTIEYVNTKVERNISKEAQSALVVAGFAYKTAAEKKLTIKVPTLGICSSLTSEVTQVSYALTARWNF